MINFSKSIQEQFNKMSDTGKLFRSKMTGQEVWDLYLANFEEGDDPVFRDPESSEHNCNHCKNFIRRYGNIVAVDSDFNIMTIFDVPLLDIEDEYKSVAITLSKKLRNKGIRDVFFETFDSLNSLPYEACKRTARKFRLGTDKNVKRYTKEEAELYGVVKPNEIRTFNHFFLDIPKKWVDMTGRSVESLMSDYRSSKNVFKRGMEEITLDALNLVKDLISQNSLLNADSHLKKVTEYIKFKEEYDQLSKRHKDNWCWVKSYQLPFAKFRNELIGVLCTDLSTGVDLNKACLDWNKRVDPANFMKATAPITEAQKKKDVKIIEDLGYMASFTRRLATLEDIKASEIKHMNVGDGKLKSGSIFDVVKTTPKKATKVDTKKVKEVSIEDFMENILPKCTSVEAYLEPKHEGNLVTMFTSEDEDVKNPFAWNNPYSITYKGNLSGKSMIKEKVQSVGGKVDGVLRFSIMWSNGDQDNSDLDAHCVEPTKRRIYYSNKINRETGGNLDVDIMNPLSDTKSKDKAVENITYPLLKKMPNGEYHFSVHQYSARNSKGFSAEIEFDGSLYNYVWDKSLKTGDRIQVATVTKVGDRFEIKHHITPSDSVVNHRELYGLSTNEFHKVNLICNSPNHWGNDESGNKHYLFMLDECKADQPLRTFHCDGLNAELKGARKTLERFGTVTLVETEGKDQLSGIGFNSTMRDDIVLRLTGTKARLIKVKF